MTTHRPLPRLLAVLSAVFALAVSLPAAAPLLEKTDLFEAGKNRILFANPHNLERLDGKATIP